MAGPGPHATSAAADPPAAARWGRLAGRLGPPLVLMAVVWWLSAQPGLRTDLGGIDLILRKGAHITEYALLALLWHRALRWGSAPSGPEAPGRTTHARAAWTAAAIALTWAIVDEIHQHYVRDRVGAPGDVGIDAMGIVIGVAVADRLHRRRAARAATRS